LLGQATPSAAGKTSGISARRTHAAPHAVYPERPEVFAGGKTASGFRGTLARVSRAVSTGEERQIQPAPVSSGHSQATGSGLLLGLLGNRQRVL
jgi:hypothetical protein